MIDNSTQGIENIAGCHLVTGTNRLGNSTLGYYVFVFLVSFFPYFFPLWCWLRGQGVEPTPLCVLRKYPTTELYPQPKYISSEALSQDSGVVHGLGQGGAPDLQSQNSDTYYGIGVEPTHLSCMGICITGFLWMP